MNVIEPLSKYNITYKAQPMIIKNFIPKAYNPLSYLSPIPKKYSRSAKPLSRSHMFLISENKPEKRHLLDIHHYKPLTSFTLKVEVAKCNLKNRPLAEECAMVLDDVLEAVSQGFLYFFIILVIVFPFCYIK